MAERLVRMAVAAVEELWHTSDHAAFVSVLVDRTLQHWPVRSTHFKRWLRREARRHEGSVVGANAIEDALNALESIAEFDGPQHVAYRRLAGDDEVIWIALEVGRVARVDAHGWRIIDAGDAPSMPRFIWPNGMLPLPQPQEGGELKNIEQLVNCPPDAWPMIATWLVCALRPGRPYPILNIEGEHGSGKSGLANLLRALVDPNRVPLRRPPKDDRDLAISCLNGHVVAFDNLSGLRADLSDALCGIATGIGFATRRLFSDTEETQIEALCPVLLNGIFVAGRPDLLDRTLPVDLPPIPDGKRRAQAEVKQAIQDAMPRLLGALLTALSTAIRNLPRVKEQPYELPRMADAMQWSLAAASALGLTEDELYAAVWRARDEQARDAIESDLVGAALLQLLGRLETWEGTAADLLQALQPYVPGEAARRHMPATPTVLGHALARLKPGLRRIGIVIEEPREGGTGRRMKRIRWEDEARRRHDCHRRHAPR